MMTAVRQYEKHFKWMSYQNAMWSSWKLFNMQRFKNMMHSKAWANPYAAWMQCEFKWLKVECFSQRQSYAHVSHIIYPRQHLGVCDLKYNLKEDKKKHHSWMID